MNRFLNFVYTWALERVEDPVEWQRLLNEPIYKDIKVVTARVAEEDFAIFKQAQGTLTPGGE